MEQTPSLSVILLTPEPEWWPRQISWCSLHSPVERTKVLVWQQKALGKQNSSMLNQANFSPESSFREPQMKCFLCRNSRRFLPGCIGYFLEFTSRFIFRGCKWLCFCHNAGFTHDSAIVHVLWALAASSINYRTCSLCGAQWLCLFFEAHCLFYLSHLAV